MSTLNVDSLAINSGYGSQTPISGCRAWVNFDGSDTFTSGGETRCTLLGSGNVSKVVKRTSGGTTYVYDVYFETPMPDTNYAALFGCTAKVGTNSVYNPVLSEYTTNTSTGTTRQRSASYITVLLNNAGFLEPESASVVIIR